MANKLSNAQLEILQVFATPMSDERLEELRKLLLEFRAEELTRLVNGKFDEMCIHPDELLKEHMRTPYIKNH